MASKEQKKLVDNYPRGKIGLDQGSISAEKIDITNPAGVIFIDEGKTVFIPYHKILSIIYDEVPQEIIDARANAAKTNQPSS